MSILKKLRFYIKKVFSGCIRTRHLPPDDIIPAFINRRLVVLLKKRKPGISHVSMKFLFDRKLHQIAVYFIRGYFIYDVFNQLFCLGCIWLPSVGIKRYTFSFSIDLNITIKRCCHPFSFIYHAIHGGNCFDMQHRFLLSTETTVSSGPSACNLLWEIYLLCTKFYTPLPTPTLHGGVVGG